MRLATFLETSHGPILDAAVAFARTLPVLQAMDDHTLRDHLPELLHVISVDLGTGQSRTAAISKSQGAAPSSDHPTSAQTHGLVRARSGLTIEQLIAEYRALRSSVLRLWTEAAAPGPDAVDDIMRFNEAIDQAVAESVQFYSEERERWRDLFLGVLGHDLRGPLNTLTLTVESMRMEGGQPSARTALLMRGVNRLTSLLDSLLEYNRSNFGVGMTLQLAPADLAHACAEEVDLLRAAHPAARIDYVTAGSTDGTFDVSRVREALMNLVSNAVKHGDATQPTVVRVEGGDRSVGIAVENTGEIPPQEIDMLFEPLYQRSTPAERAERTHLGLGLFIVRQIARAHGGEASGCCTGRRVCFAIELPKAGPTGA